MMPDPLGDEDYTAMAEFRHAMLRFLRFSQRAARDAGFSPQQHQALLAIRAAPQRTMAVGQLAERLLLRPNSASELVDRLERLDFVERSTDTQDRRQIRITLTAKGCDALASLSAIHRSELRSMRTLLNQLMERL